MNDDDPRYFTLTQGAWIPTSEWNFVERWAGTNMMLVAKGVRFVLHGGRYWTYSPFGFRLNQAQAAIVEPLLEEAEPRIGQWLDSCGEDELAVLAALGELGIVTEKDIKRAAALVHQDSMDEHGDILHRNWILDNPEG